MARFCPSLLLLVAAVVLVSKGVHAWDSPKVVRKFQDIPESYVYVQQALWFAMKEYNKISKDKYIFKVVKVLKSQEQVTDSLDYFLEVKIARTMCKKISGENENCLLQKNPKMQKVTRSAQIQEESIDSSLNGQDIMNILAGEELMVNILVDHLPQEFLCTFIVASRPWKFELTMLKQQCKDI